MITIIYKSVRDRNQSHAPLRTRAGRHPPQPPPRGAQTDHRALRPTPGRQDHHRSGRRSHGSGRRIASKACLSPPTNPRRNSGVGRLDQPSQPRREYHRLACPRSRTNRWTPAGLSADGSGHGPKLNEPAAPSLSLTKSSAFPNGPRPSKGSGTATVRTAARSMWSYWDQRPFSCKQGSARVSSGAPNPCPSRTGPSGRWRPLSDSDSTSSSSSAVIREPPT